MQSYGRTPILQALSPVPVTEPGTCSSVPVPVPVLVPVTEPDTCSSTSSGTSSKWRWWFWFQYQWGNWVPVRS